MANSFKIPGDPRGSVTPGIHSRLGLRVTRDTDGLLRVRARIDGYASVPCFAERISSDATRCKSGSRGGAARVVTLQPMKRHPARGVSAVARRQGVHGLLLHCGRPRRRKGWGRIRCERSAASNKAYREATEMRRANEMKMFKGPSSSRTRTTTMPLTRHPLEPNRKSASPKAGDAKSESS